MGREVWSGAPDTVSTRLFRASHALPVFTLALHLGPKICLAWESAACFSPGWLQFLRSTELIAITHNNGMNTPFPNHLHLYRALLREANYLFTSAAQKFHYEHVRWSFRRHRDRQDPDRCQPEPLLTQHESRQLKRGRKYLYMLQRANQGYMRSVQNVLKMTYARSGKRRREMLKSIMTPASTNTSSQALLPHQTLRAEYLKDWQPPSKFTALLNSQTKIHSHLDLRGKLKARPSIPTQNKWNKPFPRSRVRTLMKRWYAKSANMLMAPLFEKEWSEVYNLSTNRPGVEADIVPVRRQPASVPVFCCPKETDSTSLINVASIARTDPQRRPSQLSRRVQVVIGNPHRLTARFIRRITQRTVLQSTPTALVNPDTGKVAFRWDHGERPRQTPMTASGSQQMSLFG